MNDAPTMQILLASAVSIGFFHTLIGIDHSLPFMVMGRAHGWTLRKVLGITFLCGLGHVLSSVVLGFLGIGLGVALERLEWIEATRGEWAAWSLILFGSVYAAWSFARERRRAAHTHVHADGTVHAHAEGGSAAGAPEHAHADPARAAAHMTAWSLFVIFVLGPCEPLIPLLMVPAVGWGWGSVALVSLAFGLTTIGTMMAVVTVGYLGLGVPSFGHLERYAHTLAGVAIAGSGLAIQVLGV